MLVLFFFFFFCLRFFDYFFSCLRAWGVLRTGVATLLAAGICAENGGWPIHPTRLHNPHGL